MRNCLFYVVLTFCLGLMFVGFDSQAQTRSKEAAAKTAAKQPAKQALKGSSKTNSKVASKPGVKTSAKTTQLAKNKKPAAVNSKLKGKKPIDEEEDDEEEEDDDSASPARKSKAVAKKTATLKPQEGGSTGGSKVIYRLSIYKAGTRIKLMDAPAIALGPDLVACAFDSVAIMMDTNRELQTVVEVNSQVFVNALLTEVDVINNLALLKLTDRKLADYLPPSKIRRDNLEVGESLTLYGYQRNTSLMQWTTVAANAMSDGLMTAFRTQMAADKVIAGSIVFDSDKKWLGVIGKSEQSVQAIGNFAGPAIDMISRNRQPAAIAGFKTFAVNQYGRIQGNWLASLYSPDKSVGVKAKNWTLGATPRSFDCQTESFSLSEQQVVAEIGRSEVWRCQNPVTVSGSDWLPAGMEIVSGVVQFKNPSLDAGFKGKFEEDLTHTWRKKFDTNTADIGTYSGKDCQQSSIRNAKGQNISTEFCTAAHRTAAGLNDWVVRLNTWSENGEGAFIVTRLKGFQLETAQKVVSKLADELRREP